HTVTHGGFAAVTERELEGKTKEIFTALASDVPVTEDGALPRPDVLAVRLLAEVLVRLERVSAYVMRRGYEDREGRQRPAAELELRLREHALALARELGMTPASRAKLRSEEHTSELQSLAYLVCRLLL